MPTLHPVATLLYMWAGGKSNSLSWRFQGRILESATGSTDLYDFQARSYDPSLGAFTSFDSVTGSAQNPLTLNRFLYANANPATLVDPDGHSSCYDSFFVSYCGNQAPIIHTGSYEAAARTQSRRASNPGAKAGPQADRFTMAQAAWINSNHWIGGKVGCGSSSDCLGTIYDHTWRSLVYTPIATANYVGDVGTQCLTATTPQCVHAINQANPLNIPGRLLTDVQTGNAADFGDLLGGTAGGALLAKGLAKGGGVAKGVLADDSAAAADASGADTVGGSSRSPLGNPDYLGKKPINKPATIAGRDYSGHALDQMQNRGITPTVVENTISNGTIGPGKYPGTYIKYDPVNNITVVLSWTNRVVTVSYGDLRP